MKFILLKWMRSLDFIVLSGVLVLMGVGAYAFADFAIYAFTSNLALNSLILGALLIGSFMIYQQSYRLFRERYLMQWWHGEVMKSSQARHKLPGFANKCMVNDLIDRVDRMGSDVGLVLTADVVEAEVERIAHQLDHNQELCRFMVGLMVALGLLGTFVGLLETLVQVSDLVSSIGTGMSDKGNAEAAMSNVIMGLKNPMKAMGTAFSASMFGLIGSIVLGLQMVRLGQATSSSNRDIRSLSLRAMERMSAGHPKAKGVEIVLAEYMDELGAHGRQMATNLDRMLAMSDAAVPMLREIGAHMRDSAAKSEGLTNSLFTVTDSIQKLSFLPALFQESMLVSRDALAQAAVSHQSLEQIGKSQEHLLEIMAQMSAAMSVGLGGLARQTEQLSQAVVEGFSVNQSNGQLHLDAALRTITDVRNSIDSVALGVTTAGSSTLASLDALTGSIESGKTDAQARFDTDRRQMGESIAQAARALEYLALMQSSLSPIPGMTRDLRTMIAELPRRDDALTSFALAVERFNGVLSSLTKVTGTTAGDDAAAKP